MSNFTFPAETLYFLKNLPIELNYKNTKKYFKCNSYKVKLLEQGHVWHQIIVLHKGKVHGVEGRKMILDALYDAVGDEEIFPIAYRSGSKMDKFLLRSCHLAMKKLFDESLRLQLSNGVIIYLECELNVGNYSFGQISPYSVINDALDDLYTRMEHVNGEDGILNLSNFSEHREFVNMIVNLRNPGVFNVLCKAIYKNNDKFRKVNGLTLSNNGITTLTPLEVFNGIEFAVLDLRNNKLSSASRICRSLAGIKANAFYLNGNPIVRTAKYPSCLDYILKNFQTIDNIPVKTLSKDYNPINTAISRNNNGYSITQANKNDINRFCKSTNWHLVSVPDEQEEISKEELFDYFFVTVSPNYTDLYPCYYTFSDGKHQFLLRECFDQLKYLVKECNLEIKIPRLINPDEFSSNNTDGDVPMLVEINKVLNYTLCMDFMTFQQGQIVPSEVIDKALDRCYEAMDGVLNLENFQATEGLENIIVNLTSTNILNRVLLMAGRKYIGLCTDLCLAQNKILTADLSKSLIFMNNIKFIDLGNNWIQDFDNIKEIQKFKLKSLRLDGNPLCSKYKTALEYAKIAKQYFPSLEILDNVDINAKSNFATLQNYLCDVSCYDFVEEFVPNYLQTFESEGREAIKGLYNKNAIFSMTCRYHNSESNRPLFLRIAEYVNRSANYLTHGTNHVFHGTQQIMNLFQLLPAVKYDMLSIATDTVAFNDNIVVLTISGVFQDQPKSISDAELLLAFFRTFVLVPIKRNSGIMKGSTKYEIINDQLNITKPSYHQAKNSFVYFKSDIKKEIPPMTEECQAALFTMFHGATNLKHVWCKRFLEDAKWDFKNALILFKECYEEKKIPKTAFKNCNLQDQNEF